MNEMTYIQRLLRILQILSSGKKVTIKYLHKRFEGQFSVRTLQRDIITLSEAGIPLISQKTVANENTWQLMDNFRFFIPLSLDQNEYLAAHVLRSNLKIFNNTSFGSEINALIKKIEQIVPDDLFFELDNEKAQAIFENYSSGMFDYTHHGKIIDSLIKSIINKNICDIIYYNPIKNKQKKYSVIPARLVHYKGSLYIIACIRKNKKFKIFSVQKIKKATINKKFYNIDHHFDSTLFWKSKFGMFSAKPVDVILKFSNNISHYIEGRQWHQSQKITIQKKGDLILSMKVGISPELISWIMSWHKHVIVKSPSELIKTIKSAHIKSLKLYK